MIHRNRKDVRAAWAATARSIEVRVALKNILALWARDIDAKAHRIRHQNSFLATWTIAVFSLAAIRHSQQS
jgi:hypothetical protein